MSDTIPVACFLTDQELQARRKNYLDKAADSLIESAELSDGRVFRFPLTPEMLRDLAEIIDLERRCCPFLNFRLTVEAGAAVVALELTGGAGTKDAIEALFGWR